MIESRDIIRLRMGFATVPAEESAAHAGERLALMITGVKND